MNTNELITKLKLGKALTDAEFESLLEAEGEDMLYLTEAARETAERIFSRKIFIRGLIEISNICKNDCLYCGIRRSNRCAERYRLKEDDILECADVGYKLGFRTFVLQGGEDGYYTDEIMCRIIRSIKSAYPDCAVTLSLGERSRESYRRMKEAGADRYLLRHESASPDHYGKLHPSSMSYENRIRCLNDLKELGYQTGCGFMVGSPYQTTANIISDLKFIKAFKPHMVGVGPFIPHKDTPMRDFPAGSIDLTLKILAVIRLMLPNVLLPATTALGSLRGGGRERGILAGANVVMPNLSPPDKREKYSLYNNKLATGVEAAEGINALREQFDTIGYKIVCERGDYQDIAVR